MASSLWFQYLLNVRHWEKLLQPGQEVQHEDLQSAVKFGSKGGGKHILQRDGLL